MILLSIALNYAFYPVGSQCFCMLIAFGLHIILGSISNELLKVIIFSFTHFCFFITQELMNVKSYLNLKLLLHNDILRESKSLGFKFD